MQEKYLFPLHIYAMVLSLFGLLCPYIKGSKV